MRNFLENAGTLALSPNFRRRAACQGSRVRRHAALASCNPSFFARELVRRSG
jgi:hypothetical protein